MLLPWDCGKYGYKEIDGWSVVCVHVCTCTSRRVYMFALCVCLSVYVCVCVRTRMCVCVFVPAKLLGCCCYAISSNY